MLLKGQNGLIMQKIKLEDFSPVTLADRKTILPLLLANDVFFCDYSFANLFMWGDIFRQPLAAP